MILKKRILEPNQEVIILFETNLGFIFEDAIFIKYQPIKIGKIEHNIPFFLSNIGEISGITCFWVLKSDIQDNIQVEFLQRQIIELQIEAAIISKKLGYNIPMKLQDKEMQKMINEKTNKIKELELKFGYDPTDLTWILSLASSDQEKNWFEYENDNKFIWDNDWVSIVSQFNKTYNHNITPEIAKQYSKKRMRFNLGSYHIRLSGNSNKSEWEIQAKKFEEKHRLAEIRMLKWSMFNMANFPLVKTKTELNFWHGPYFHEFLERYPDLFSWSPINGNRAMPCKKIKVGTILRVISYDSVEKFIRLDFLPEIRNNIVGREDNQPWVKDKADYEIYVKPDEIEASLEFLSNLE